MQRKITEKLIKDFLTTAYTKLGRNITGLKFHSNVSIYNFALHRTKHYKDVKEVFLIDHIKYMIYNNILISCHRVQLDNSSYFNNFLISYAISNWEINIYAVKHISNQELDDFPECVERYYDELKI